MPSGWSPVESQPSRVWALVLHPKKGPLLWHWRLRAAQWVEVPCTGLCSTLSDFFFLNPIVEFLSKLKSRELFPQGSSFLLDTTKRKWQTSRGNYHMRKDWDMQKTSSISPGAVWIEIGKNDMLMFDTWTHDKNIITQLELLLGCN